MGNVDDYTDIVNGKTVDDLQCYKSKNDSSKGIMVCNDDKPGPGTPAPKLSEKCSNPKSENDCTYNCPPGDIKILEECKRNADPYKKKTSTKSVF